MAFVYGRIDLQKAALESSSLRNNAPEGECTFGKSDIIWSQS